MICLNCRTPNEEGNTFCVNCGNTLTATSGPLPHSPVDSTETAVIGHVQQASMPHFTPNYPSTGAQKPSSAKPFIWVGVGLIAALVLGSLGFVFVMPKTGPGEVLPDHLGMFVQAETKDRYDEIRKQDFANALDGKAALIKDENLSTVPPSPSLIFYADSRDININDMRLVLLDTIKDDGSMKQIDFQAAQVDGKPEMKRLRVIDPLANGKYAFVVFDSYLNEGKQRFWPFQVRNSSKSDNGDALKASSVPIKPKEPAQKAPATNVPRTAVPPPPAGPPQLGLRTVIGNGVRLRMGPSMGAAFHPTFRFNRNSTVNVVGYTGYECPSTGKGCGPWAQLDNGYYVHSSLLR